MDMHFYIWLMVPLDHNFVYFSSLLEKDMKALLIANFQSVELL